MPTRESIDIAKVTEDIQEMTKQSQNIDEKIVSPTTTTTTTTVTLEETPKTTTTINPEKDEKEQEDTKDDEEAVVILETERDKTNEKPFEKKSDDIEPVEKIEETKSEKNEETDSKIERIEVDRIEINRVIEENLEIIKDINDNNSDDSDSDVELRKKSTKSGLGRSDSFSVKEQIEHIEKQIKELESKKISNGNENGLTINGKTNTDIESTVKNYEQSDTRLSIQANRRSFFKNMVGNNGNDSHSGVKIEIKELPREQKEIEVVKLTDPPIEINSVLKDPVKIVELHISEPIKQIPEIVDEININPLPKPRRHSSVQNKISNGNNQLNFHNKNDDYKESVVDKNSQIFRGDSL